MRKKSAIAILIVCLSFIYFSIPANSHADGTPPEHFVTRDGDHLAVDGHQFYFNMSNNDHLYYWSQFMVDDVLHDAAGLGLTAFRVWASSEGQDARKLRDGVYYGFQQLPGVYDEATFVNLDHMIAKARDEGMRLIIPLVNNWDDDYGGIPQYTKWSVSAKSDLLLSVYNPGTPCNIAIAIRTGSSQDWYETRSITITTGWNEVAAYLQSPVWMCAATGWYNYVSPVANLDDVCQLDILVYTSNGIGSIYIDNIRLGPSGRAIVWDRAEVLDNEPQHSWEQGLWRIDDNANDSTGVSINSDHRIEGWYSIKLDFNPALPHGKAIWRKDTKMPNHDVFYFDAYCKTLYKNYINHVLTRTNTITGVMYKDDPTILMWELANEPRCETDASGDTLQAWIDEMAPYIKSIDPYHLLSTGGEGYYKKPGALDWRHDGSQGADFIRNSQSPYINIASFHLYPEGYGMTDQEAIDWITEHLTDAHTLLGMPVYLGEFGITADRKATRLNGFDTGVEGWSTELGYSDGPTQVEAPTRDNNGSIRFTANMNQAMTSATGRIEYSGSGVDYSAYDYFSGWVYVPVGAPTGLGAEMYVQAGQEYKWVNGDNASLTPGTWAQVKVTANQIRDGGANISQVRRLGIKIKRGSTDYAGAVYYDLIGVNLKDVYETPYQMARRNQLYDAWYDCLYDGDASGGGFWQLFAHRDDGSLYSDYWNWGVYYPEDAGTSAVIQEFSNKMTNKKLVLQLPSAPVATEGVKLEFTISANGPSGGTPVLTASALPSGATFTDNGNGTALFSWTPGYGQAAVNPYVIHFQASQDPLVDSGNVSIAVQNVLVFGTVNQKLPGGDVPLGEATVSVLNFTTKQVMLSTTTDDLGRFKIIAPVGTIPLTTYYINVAKDEYNTYLGIAVLRDAYSQPFMVALYPPVLSPLTNPAISENQPLSVTISATDQNPTDKLTFTATGLPAGAGFVDNGNKTATLTWTPTYTQAGDYPIGIKVTDGLLSEDKTLAVKVQDVQAADLYVPSLNAILTHPLLCVFSASLANKGELASGPFNIAWKVDGKIIETRTIQNIKAGRSTLELLLTRLSRGTHITSLTVDPSNQVLERDENNNIKEIKIVVK